MEDIKKTENQDDLFRFIGDAAKVGNLRTVIWGAWDVAMKL